jgi:RimJ/RimL family protein N-acetyltransferase
VQKSADGDSFFRGCAVDQGYVFTTDRLAVRRWVDSDEPHVLDLYGQSAVVRWVDDGQPLTAAEAEHWMAVTFGNYARRGYGMFAIEDRNSSTIIGFGGIVHPNDQTEPEIKYAFQPDVWGAGLATEFVRGLVEYGQTSLGLQNFIATVAAENSASIRVLEKAGLQRTGIREEDDGSKTVVLELDER